MNEWVNELAYIMFVQMPRINKLLHDVCQNFISAVMYVM